MSSTSIPQQYTSQTTEAAYKNVISTVKHLKLRSDLLRYSGGIFSWFASALIILTGLALLGNALNLPPILRILMIVIFIAFDIWTGYIFLADAIFRRTSIDRMAFRIEQEHPELQDRLISSLQLWSELSEDKYGYSAGFISKVVEEASSSLNKIDKSKIFTDDIKKFRRGILMICVLLPLVVSMAISPSVFRYSFNTFVHPFADGRPPIPVKIISITPGDHKLAAGGSIDIIANVTGLTPSTANLHHRTGKQEWRTMVMPGTKDASKNVFSTRLQNIKESLEYYVSIADAQSQHYSIGIVQRPIVDSLKLSLRYPKYTDLPAKSLDENMGDVVAPLGTRVMIEATSSKDIASAFIIFGDDKEETRLGVGAPRKMTGDFLIQQSGHYHITITDTEGQSNSDPIQYSINALTDQSPRISIVRPGEDITIGEEMVIQLQIDAQDDYGVANINLKYRVEGQSEEQEMQLWNEIPQIGVSLAHTWNLAPLQLFPEDIITYYAEAADADNISGPNIGRSAVFVARFPSLYELYKQTEMEQDIQQAEMEDIQAQQDEVKDMVDDLIDELKKEKELDWAGEKELEKAAELQERIKEQMEELVEEVKETVEKIEKNPLIGTEAMEKLQELRDLMEEVVTDEMKQIMRKLSEAMDEANPSQQQKDLMSASFQQEEFVEKLDSMIDMFKKMQLKQKMDAAANQAEELVRQQTETLEKSEELSNQETADKTQAENLADKENRIKEQTEELLSELDKLAEEMKEKFSNIAQAIQQSKKRAEQGKIPEQLEQASSQLKNMNISESLPCQLNALSKLSQLQEDLQQAAEAMEGEDMSELVAKLSDAIRKSLYLSHQHEEIMQAMSAFDGDPQEMLPKEKEAIDSLAASEIDLAEGAQKVAEQLKDLSHETPSVRPELAWSMERVANGMNRAAAAMEDKLPALSKPIQASTLATLNSAIENMLKSIDQISENATPMMGMEDYMEQLRQLANQQSQLNQSTQEADAMRRRMGSTPSAEDMLEKLAVEQSLIREATERLSGKFDELAEALGRLEEVAKEMREVEEELREGSVGRKTLDRQQRILTRLLDYEKSLKEQDLSKEREARSGRTYVAEKPASVLPTDATEIKKQLDIMNFPATQERWPAQYRELIRMYYKALSNSVRMQSGASK